MPCGDKCCQRIHFFEKKRFSVLNVRTLITQKARGRFPQRERPRAHRVQKSNYAAVEALTLSLVLALSATSEVLALSEALADSEVLADAEVLAGSETLVLAGLYSLSARAAEYCARAFVKAVSDYSIFCVKNKMFFVHFNEL